MLKKEYIVVVLPEIKVPRSKLFVGETGANRKGTKIAGDCYCVLMQFKDTSSSK